MCNFLLPTQANPLAVNGDFCIIQKASLLAYLNEVIHIFPFVMCVNVLAFWFLRRRELCGNGNRLQITRGALTCHSLGPR